MITYESKVSQNWHDNEKKDYVQLDWPSIVGWAYASIFAVAVRFQIQDQFWILWPQLHAACILDFLEKSKNELVRPKTVFLAILAKK